MPLAELEVRQVFGVSQPAALADWPVLLALRRGLAPDVRWVPSCSPGDLAERGDWAPAVHSVVPQACSPREVGWLPGGCSRELPADCWVAQPQDDWAQAVHSVVPQACSSLEVDWLPGGCSPELPADCWVAQPQDDWRAVHSVVPQACSPLEVDWLPGDCSLELPADCWVAQPQDDWAQAAHSAGPLACSPREVDWLPGDCSLEPRRVDWFPALRHSVAPPDARLSGLRAYPEALP